MACEGQATQHGAREVNGAVVAAPPPPPLALAPLVPLRPGGLMPALGTAPAPAATTTPASPAAAAGGMPAQPPAMNRPALPLTGVAPNAGMRSVGPMPAPWPTGTARPLVGPAQLLPLPRPARLPLMPMPTSTTPRPAAAAAASSVAPPLRPVARPAGVAGLQLAGLQVTQQGATPARPAGVAGLQLPQQGMRPPGMAGMQEMAARPATQQRPSLLPVPIRPPPLGPTMPAAIPAAAPPVPAPTLASHVAAMTAPMPAPAVKPEPGPAPNGSVIGVKRKAEEVIQPPLPLPPQQPPPPLASQLQQQAPDAPLLPLPGIPAVGVPMLPHPAGAMTVVGQPIDTVAGGVLPPMFQPLPANGGIAQADDGDSGDEEAAARAGAQAYDAAALLAAVSEAGGSNKKARLVWTQELHNRFINALSHLGLKNAVPKRILDLMNVEGMTRENVASHLQKYRQFLRKMGGLSVRDSGDVEAMQRLHKQNVQAVATQQMLQHSLAAMQGAPAGALSGMGMSGYMQPGLAQCQAAGVVDSAAGAAAVGAVSLPEPLPLKMPSLDAGAGASSALDSLANLAAAEELAEIAAAAAAAAGSGAAGIGGTSASTVPVLAVGGLGAANGFELALPPGIPAAQQAQEAQQPTASHGPAASAAPVQPTLGNEGANGSRNAAAPGLSSGAGSKAAASAQANGMAHPQPAVPAVAAASAAGHLNKPADASLAWPSAPGTPPE